VHGFQCTTVLRMSIHAMGTAARSGVFQRASYTNTHTQNAHYLPNNVLVKRVNAFMLGMIRVIFQVENLLYYKHYIGWLKKPRIDNIGDY